MSQAFVQLHPIPNFEKFLIKKNPQKMYSISNISTWNHFGAKARTPNESRPSFVVQGTSISGYFIDIDKWWPIF